MARRTPRRRRLTTLTTVGYGDITPCNNIERAYCLFAMLVGAMMFGYMMSTIGSMVRARLNNLSSGSCEILGSLLKSSRNY